VLSSWEILIYFSPVHWHVEATGVELERSVQRAIWAEERGPKNKAVMRALDSVNECLGMNTVRFAAQGYSKAWKLRTEHLSNCYTAKLDHIIKVKDKA
jgi:DNA polymerase V